MKESLVLKENNKTTMPRQVDPAYFGQRILVIAPHPDDEVIGCGATIKSCSQMGACIRCLYITSGEATKAGDGMLKVEKARIREAEAKAAGEILGISERIMWRLPDGQVESEDLLAPLTQLLQEFEPSAIFLPADGDNHADHRAVSSAVASLTDLGKTKRFGYEVWRPIQTPQVFIGAHTTFKAKQKALKKYRFAGKVQNYLRWVTALGIYRSNLIGGNGYVEVFTEYQPVAEKKQNQTTQHDSGAQLKSSDCLVI